METKIDGEIGGRRALTLMFRDHPDRPTPEHYPADRWMIGPSFPDTPRGMEMAEAAKALLDRTGLILNLMDRDREFAPMLVLSTGHLPSIIGVRLNGYDGVHAHEKTDRDDQVIGWFMWVPNDPLEQAAGHPADDDGVPDEVLTVQLYARALGCGWVMFDADGPAVDDLPSWAW